ncbi:phosphoglycerol transferase MdoB-like AlkP superfamily enzyme [Chryseomicrobium aureum]|uniref:LTA synthase family protein n=1 Tax=Chryseomicrobium aureum TaxID=1441723 RepID=UPI00195D1851|nr:LTA synthase family protein [Chryseomicrobium aureum]MBM7705728.1 phosphoglycerol transferase MdoB-like AlkP superfamily enzyme [Chryseomicrobium aureum]
MKKWSTHSLLFAAIVLTWLKTFTVYHTSFDLKLENIMQQFILFLNPLSFILVFFGLSLFFSKESSRRRFILAGATILSIVLYANVVFYRFFTDFITLPVLFQTSNFGDLGSSAKSSIYFTDIFYFVDVILLFVIARKLTKQNTEIVQKQIHRKAYFVFAAAIFFLNLGLAEIERPQLLTRSFDREMLVKNIGTYNYHIYDAYVQSKSQAQRAFADGSELVEVNNYVRANHVDSPSPLEGIAKDKNIIVVSMESIQNFVINEEMNGEVITPFLNELTQDPDTMYYSNFYHQTGLGKTSDSEFIVENSLYPLGGGAVFFTHGGNTYNSLSERLGENGYHTSVMHANNKSFWNRDMMYQSLGIEKFFDIDSYTIEEGQAVNWGMKDIPFFEQSVELMKDIPQPFYTRMITLTNHYPFTLDEEDKFIPEYDSNSGTLNRYFQTVRYMDESLRVLFDELKAAGLYEDSIIVMYGDHYGISENHNRAMSQYLGEEVTPYVSSGLQEVPLFIHIPDSGMGGEKTDIAGQIDLRPTILHMAGIDSSKDIQLGTNLFAEDREQKVVFRDGGFTTENFVFTKNTCYDAKTGLEIEAVNCEEQAAAANQELNYSDQLINGDLLRFYNRETGQLLIEEGSVEEPVEEPVVE